MSRPPETMGSDGIPEETRKRGRPNLRRGPVAKRIRQSRLVNLYGDGRAPRGPHRPGWRSLRLGISEGDWSIERTSRPLQPVGKQITQPGKRPRPQYCTRRRRCCEERLGDLRDAALSSLDEVKSAAAEKLERRKIRRPGKSPARPEGLEAAAERWRARRSTGLASRSRGRPEADRARRRGKEYRHHGGRASEFGRQNPVAYLGGAALVGFALARFARASTPAGTSTPSPERLRRGTGGSIGRARPIPHQLASPIRRRVGSCLIRRTAPHPP